MMRIGSPIHAFGGRRKLRMTESQDFPLLYSARFLAALGMTTARRNDTAREDFSAASAPGDSALSKIEERSYETATVRRSIAFLILRANRTWQHFFRGEYVSDSRWALVMAIVWLGSVEVCRI